MTPIKYLLSSITVLSNIVAAIVYIYAIVPYWIMHHYAVPNSLYQDTPPGACSMYNYCQLKRHCMDTPYTPCGHPMWTPHTPHRRCTIFPRTCWKNALFDFLCICQDTIIKDDGVEQAWKYYTPMVKTWSPSFQFLFDISSARPLWWQ